MHECAGMPEPDKEIAEIDIAPYQQEERIESFES